MSRINTMYEDSIYEELETTSLDEIEEFGGDGLDQYQDDYRAFERDLTDLIKERK